MFFICGILVGLVAFKVCCSHIQILIYFWLGDFCLYVYFAGIGGSTETRCGSLFARSWVERRNSNVVIDTACSIAQHIVICITRFAVINGISIVRSMAISCAWHGVAFMIDLSMYTTITLNRTLIVGVVMFFCICVFSNCCYSWALSKRAFFF